jgi:hypothetical protein
MDLPKKMIQVMRQFEEVFSERVWEWAKVLLIGAILATARTYRDGDFARDGTEPGTAVSERVTRVLNRARWSSRALSRIVLHLLVKTFVPDGASIVVGIDETIERRRGAKIAAKGIYRDPVRSSKEFFVKTSGLRWVSMMLLAPIRFSLGGSGLCRFSACLPHLSATMSSGGDDTRRSPIGGGK